MSIIEERVEEFLERAEKMLACGLTERFLRMQAKREGVLDYIQILARDKLDET